MRYEYYFTNKVDIYTWEHFLIKEHHQEIEKYYDKITSYGWKDKFGFNPNGIAIYISEHGDLYRGIWFDTNNKRIAIFSK